MNSAQALAKARKLLGAKAFIRVNDKALIGEAREQQHAAWRAARDAQTATQAALDARRIEVLKADADYQRLKVELAAATKLTESLTGFRRRRVQVGTASSIFNTIHAEGDNFTEALDALATEKGRT